MSTLAESERAAFEAEMRRLFSVGAKPGDFDEPSSVWFTQIEDGRYEVARIDDAWTGWKLRAAAIPGERECERLLRMVVDCDQDPDIPNPDAYTLMMHRIAVLADAYLARKP